MALAICKTGCRSVALSAVSECKIRIRLVKGTKGCYVAHFVTSTLLVCLVDLIDRSIRFSRFARASAARPVGPAGRGAGMKYTRPRGRPQGGGGVSTGRTHLLALSAFLISLPIACKANTSCVQSQHHTMVYRHVYGQLEQRPHVQDIRYRIQSPDQIDDIPYRALCK